MIERRGKNQFTFIKEMAMLFLILVIRGERSCAYKILYPLKQEYLGSFLSWLNADMPSKD